MKAPSAQALIDAERALVGTPYQHQGRTIYGVDCIGIHALAAKQIGLDLFATLGIKDARDYTRRSSPRFLEMTRTHLQPATKLAPGVLVFLHFGTPKRPEPPQHYALFTERGTIIHAHATIGRVTEHGYRAPWPAREHSLWLVPGIHYDSGA